jgi:HipA-like protein
MRKAAIYRNGVLAGILTEENRQHFIFKYDDTYFQDGSNLTKK